MAGDEQEKTEAPTPKRREEAHREGRFPRSQELTGAAVLLTAAAALVYAGGSMMGRQVTELLREGTSWLATGPLTVGTAQAMLAIVAQHFALAFLPVAGAVALAIVTVNLVQTRGTISTGGLKLKFDNLNPVNGLGRVFSAKSLFTLAKAVVKLVVLGLITWRALEDALPQVLSLSASPTAEVLTVTQALVFRLTLTGGFAFLVVAAADYLFETYQFEQGLKMSKQEVIQEHRESDGNPMVKSRLRALGAQLRRKRMLANVKKADVVVTNPTHIAVALQYEFGTGGAPIVLAMGERKLAERIKAIAKEAGVPTVENRPLARALLATAKVGRPIPVDLYSAVAEVLAFVYRRQGRMPA